MIRDVFVRSKRNTDIPASIYVNEDAGGLMMLVHSFRSDRKEDGRYIRIAEKAYENGLNVISMDFPGNGESREDFSLYSLTSCLDDMESCYGYMKEHYKFNHGKMILLGYSMGGRLISLFQEKHREFSELVFWAALIRNFGEHDLFLEQDLSEVKKSCCDGVCNFYDIFEKKYERMSEIFVDDLMERDALMPLKGFEGRALIVQGKKDRTIEVGNADLIWETLSESIEKKLVWIDEANHGFGLWDGRRQDDERLIAETLAFLGFIESEGRW